MALFSLGFSLFCFGSLDADLGATVLIIASGTTTVEHLRSEEHK